jgi:hypothetical protein
VLLLKRASENAGVELFQAVPGDPHPVGFGDAGMEAIDGRYGIGLASHEPQLIKPSAFGHHPPREMSPPGAIVCLGGGLTTLEAHMSNSAATPFVETTELVPSEVQQMTSAVPDSDQEAEIQEALAERDFWRW